MAVRHYYSFKSSRLVGDKLCLANWDLLRTRAEDSDFAFEPTQKAYEEACIKRKDCADMALLVAEILSKHDLSSRKLISLGVGKGILEWHLKKLCPDLVLCCSDYAKQGLRRLGEYFPACGATEPFDILNGDYSIFDLRSTLLLNRVSTEFCSRDWRLILRKIHAARLETVVFIPTEVAGIKIR